MVRIIETNKVAGPNVFVRGMRKGAAHPFAEQKDAVLAWHAPHGINLEVHHGRALTQVQLHGNTAEELAAVLIRAVAEGAGETHAEVLARINARLWKAEGA